MKKTIAIGLFAALSFMTNLSCERVIQEEDPVISFNETKLVVPSEGGSFSLGFDIENPLDGTALLAECDAEWVEVITVSGTALELEVAPNEETSERSVELHISYDGTDFSASAEIVQGGLQEPASPFTISVTETGPMNVVFDIVPSDAEMTYVANVYDKADYDAFSGDEDFVASVLDGIERYAQMYGKTLEEYLAEILLKGDIIGGESELLVPDNEMYVYAFGLDSNGESLTEVVTEPFRTSKSGDVDVTFEISYIIDGPLAEVTVIPSQKDVLYLCDAVEKSEYTDIQTLRREYQEFVLQMISFSEFSPEQYIASVAKTGDVVFDAEYKASTEYVGFAVAVTADGELVSDMSIKEFVTTEVDESVNRLKITVSNVTESSADCDVTATNDDPYIFGWSDAEYWEGKTPNEIRDEIIETEYTRYYQTRRGSASPHIPFLQPGTEYIVFVFGFENGEATTDMVLERFTTNTIEDSDVKFEISYDKYFDGDEMAAMYPDDFFGAEGFAVLPVRAQGTPEADVQGVLYHIVEGDYTDPAGSMSDADVLNFLKGFGQSAENVSFYLKYDTVCTIWGVAQDNNGSYGDVFRQTIMLSKDGVSPVEEFNNQSAAKVQQIEKLF